MNKLSTIMTLSESSMYLGVPEEYLIKVSKENNIKKFDINGIVCFLAQDISLLKKNILSPNSKSLSTQSIEIHNVLQASDIILQKSGNKKDILHNLIRLISQKKVIHSSKEIETGIFKREELMSTGIGLEIAIPHVRLDSVDSLVMAAASVKEGIIDYETLNDTPVKLVFMIVANTKQHADHLKIVSQLSLKLKQQDIRQQLIQAQNANDFLSLLTQA